jgi:hypothetical protein
MKCVNYISNQSEEIETGNQKQKIIYTAIPKRYHETEKKQLDLRFKIQTGFSSRAFS